MLREIDDYSLTFSADLPAELLRVPLVVLEQRCPVPEPECVVRGIDDRAGGYQDRQESKNNGSQIPHDVETG